MDPEVEVNVEVTPNEEPADENNNGVPDAIETGQALERATNAQEDATEAQETAENAGQVAEVAAEIGLDAHTRISELETAVLAMGATMGQMAQTLEQMKELVSANAQATASQLEYQMRGNQPDDQPPANNHWLNRRIGF